MGNASKITPFILGTGRAGHAIERVLAILATSDPDLELAPARYVPRGADLRAARGDHDRAALFIANPHRLHADAILAGAAAGFGAIATEKPSCVEPTQLARLSGVATPTAVFHVYRQMWGPQELRRMVDQGTLGELITIEGRYWQASTAERALRDPGAPAAPSWKNDPALSGPSDTLLDVGVHWLDLVCFIQGALPARVASWKSYANAETAHRDSHVQLMLDFAGGGRAFGSISKTFHGATNHLEINVIGTRASATWTFLAPDEILVGEGRDRRVVTRKDAARGTRQPPFHATGWLEGYIEISRQLLREAFQGAKGDYPRLGPNLEMMRALFDAAGE